MDRPHPKPTARDRANYSEGACTSKFSECPGKFLKKGQRVRAKHRIFDSPHSSPEDWGWVSAEKGELGTVVHVEDDNWPTVRFDDTSAATCVSDSEVEPICFDSERKALKRFFEGLTFKLGWPQTFMDLDQILNGTCYGAGFKVAEAYINEISTGQTEGLGLSDIIATALRNLDYERP